jgi:hypothetical protein
MFILKNGNSRKNLLHKFTLVPQGDTKIEHRKNEKKAAVACEFFVVRCLHKGDQDGFGENFFMVKSLLCINIRRYSELHSSLFNLNHKKGSIQKLSGQANTDFGTKLF